MIKKTIGYGRMVLADRNFLRRIVHVEDIVVVQREGKDAAWEREAKIKREYSCRRYAV